MTIRVYNTLSGQKEDFEPLVSDKVGIYCCGPTVYSVSHVGHMVGPVIFDAVKRYLVYNGYEVTLVINITDIDDKIIVRAAEEGCSVEDLAKRVTEDYLENLVRLAVEVDHFPRATEYIDDILEIIGGLVDKGFAYPADGDVYFDVTKDADYGKLSNRKLEELLVGVRKEVSDAKRSPADFALWKEAKPGEPSWKSPWGPGRPGWHIECSAMSMKLLGKTFDIHGGGLDLCFPHHEDEIAQSESYTDQPFAKYWMHNGLMQFSDQARKIGAREDDYESQERAKMSKSKGKVVTITDLLSRYSPELVRFFLLSTHYRRPIDFSDERVEEVGKGLGRLQSLFQRAERILGTPIHELDAPTRRAELPFEISQDTLLWRVAQLRNKFLGCMDDDFNTGGAIGVLFELLTVLNRFADKKNLDEAGADSEPTEEFRSACIVLRELTQSIGILNSPPQASEDERNDNSLTPQLIDLLLEIRQDLRKSKNFAMADAVRDRLGSLGVIIEDTPGGARWKLSGP